ncbi:hypothetical protein V6N11_030458 [Hibiscus sabdariffa]|uniref:Uncharacterized protein n=1 Tax=Hibiscus sabdariffa TaxID=183260 RepID=A0ABR2PKW0_9ROSI
MSCERGSWIIQLIMHSPYSMVSLTHQHLIHGTMHALGIRELQIQHVFTPRSSKPIYWINAKRVETNRMLQEKNTSPSPSNTNAPSPTENNPTQFLFPFKRNDLGVAWLGSAGLWGLGS